MYIRYVTVENNEQVDLLFFTDTSAHVQYYRILRSDSLSGTFTEVGQVPDNGQESISFIDQSANVNSVSYYYQIEVLDSCGISSVIANTSRTIHLSVDAQDNYLDVLYWNAYESWNGTVAGYRVYRRINDSPTLELLADVGPGVLTYTDDVSGLTGSAGRITYLVEAYEGNGNAWGFKESSYSNEALAEQESKIYMPNAIVPKGINNILKPVSVFVSAPGYQLQVFNRWGQLLFETSDPSQGWDGTYKGNYVETGVYVYLIHYRNALNQVRVQKGNVAVIF
jgi:gliding motility-associated-like protein